MQSFRILHISDLHVKSPDFRNSINDLNVLGYDRVTSGFLEILPTIHQQRAVDIVCVTGDIAASGKSEQYDYAQKLFVQISKLLYLTSERFFIVPGNHDIDRSICVGEWGNVRNSVRNDHQSVVGQFFNTQTSPSIPHSLLDRSGEFKKWINKNYSHHFVGSDKRSPLGFYSEYKPTDKPFSIHISCLDSAWLCGDNNDHQKILLTTEQIDNLTHTANVPHNGFRLALVHHPFDWLIDASKCRSRLSQYIDLVLSGHAHTEEVLAYCDPNKQVRVISAGALYESQKYRNSFHIIDVELNDQGNPLKYDITFYGWSGEFWHPDNSIYSGTQNGRICWEVNENATVSTSSNQVEIVSRSKGPKPEISSTRLPYAGDYFVGRDDELDMISRCWNNPQKNVLNVIAWGGEGKSSLVNQWRASLAASSWGNAEKVFDWSFHSQGSSIFRPVSSDLFIDMALRWFGDDNPDYGSSTQKGERLAKLIQKNKTLLILDGLEPLQYCSVDFTENGRIRDPGISVLVKMLADYNPGLCIITSRIKIPDLGIYKNGTCVELPLKGLLPKYGVKLLKDIGVKGNDSDLKKISTYYKGHAFSLSLLGHYIVNALEGQAKRYSDNSLLAQDSSSEEKVGGILNSYEKWLGDGKQISLLRVLGLFDRPATLSELAVLRNSPPINILTDKLVELSSDEWNTNIKQLSDLHLIHKINREDEEAIDTHPLIREYFSIKLRKQFTIAWQEGNRRLYSFLLSGNSEAPELCDQLFQAVSHGCKANLQQEVYDKVYVPKIKQGEVVHDARRLGGYSTRLEAVASFFDRVWDKPSVNLNQKTQGEVLAEASFAIRSFGILDEAVKPLELAIKLAANNESAAMNCGNLSELYMLLGNKEKAILYADKGIEYAQNTKNIWKHNWIQMAKKADIIAKYGETDKANQYFVAAERLQEKHDTSAPIFYGVLAFKYFDFLLSPIETDIFFPVIRKAPTPYSENIFDLKEKAINTAYHNRHFQSTLHIALGDLTLARIHVIEYLISDLNHEGVINKLDSSINGLKQAGRQEYIPFALLARSRYYSAVNRYNESLKDLLEIISLSQQSHLKLHEFSATVDAVAVLEKLNKKPKSKKYYNAAQKLRSETGYSFRNDELDRLGLLLEM